LRGARHIFHQYALWLIVVPLLTLAAFIAPATARLVVWRRAHHTDTFYFDTSETRGQWH
jgi:hypothetical protein